jgi:hypothetical protein
MPIDVLILVEDAGAANMAAPLPAALAAEGLDAVLVADGVGARQFDGLGVPYRTAEAAVPVLLAALAPRLVVVGSSERPATRAPALVAAARAKGCAVVGLVDGPANAALRFRAAMPDTLLVADAVTAAAYATLGVAAARVLVVGHPHHDRVRAARAALDVEGRATVRARVLPSAPPDGYVVVLLTERSDGLDESRFRRAPDWTLHGRGGADSRTDVVIEEVLDALAARSPAPWIVLRPHPAENPGAYDRFVPEVARVSRSEPLFDLLYAADLVVGLTSVALDEAVLLGRPTLAVVPRAVERAWLASAALGLTPVVATRAALRDLVAAPPPPPDATRLATAFPVGAAARAARALAAMMGVEARA